MTASPPVEGAVSSGGGVVTGAPRRWPGLEGLVLLAGALTAYGILGQPWWIVPAGILIPGIAMGSYLAGTSATTRTPDNRARRDRKTDSASVRPERSTRRLRPMDEVIAWATFAGRGCSTAPCTAAGNVTTRSSSEPARGTSPVPGTRSGCAVSAGPRQKTAAWPTALLIPHAPCDRARAWLLSSASAKRRQMTVDRHIG
jgi:hypothetical protein